MADISAITKFGDFYQIDAELNVDKMFGEIKDFAGTWSQYNPRKEWIRRSGLCIINERGIAGPGPALDSLGEYNIEHGTEFSESDFNIPTDVYHASEELQRVIGPMLEWSVRSHFLNLHPGGYFPPHRDHRTGEQTSFRLIWPLENCNPPGVRFMLEDTTLHWDYGQCYVVNTTKAHTLFNAGAQQDSLWLVVNARVCDDSIQFISDHLIER